MQFIRYDRYSKKERNNFKKCIIEIEAIHTDYFKNYHLLERVMETLTHIFEDHLDELNVIDDDGIIFEDAENI